MVGGQALRTSELILIAVDIKKKKGVFTSKKWSQPVIHINGEKLNWN